MFTFHQSTTCNVVNFLNKTKHLKLLNLKTCLHDIIDVDKVAANKTNTLKLVSFILSIRVRFFRSDRIRV